MTARSPWRVAPALPTPAPRELAGWAVNGRRCAEGLARAVPLPAAR